MASSYSDSCSKFLDAARNGDISLLKKMAANLDDGREGWFAKIRDSDFCTALHIAAGAGNTNICKYLIEKLKTDLHCEDKKGLTAMHSASMNNRLQTALNLLDNGASISKINMLGFTPFHYATWSGGKDLLQLLLSRGSDIEAKSDVGTPLTLAACNRNRDAVEFLLQNKANLNPVNSIGTPIMMSTRISLACTDLLVKAGADPNIDFFGETPLHSAVIGSKVEIIMYLLKNGANPNTVDYMGLTPLELAARSGDMMAMIILFPVTKKIPSIPDWSINGISKYVNSKEAEEKFGPINKWTFHMAKSKGREAFKRKEYWDAINWYTVAMELDPADATVLSNMSLCYVLVDRGLPALLNAQKCVDLSPDWVKAHYREGVAWRLLNVYDSAAKSFSSALKINPNNPEIQNALREAIEAEIAFRGM